MNEKTKGRFSASVKNPQQALIPKHINSAMLGMLRDARAIVHRDAESFSEGATVLEHVGQMLIGDLKNGLHGYKDAIYSLARKAPSIQWQRVDSLFETVRQARNDSVHSGDFIRHHVIRLVELILLLEEGLSMSAKTAEDLMVRTPTTAELWHNIATIRRAMLANSFSFLPVQNTDGVWKLLSDVSVVKYLKVAVKTNDRNKLLGKLLSAALDDNEIELTDCDRFLPDNNIDDISKTLSHVPILIVENGGNKERLLGILTAFDLL
jgi:CBS domain-containing protein